MNKPTRNQKVATPKFLYDEHVVERILQRRLPLYVVKNVAQWGMVIDDNEKAKVIRGSWGSYPLHVVIVKPNIVKTVYVADEWEVAVNARRIKDQQAVAVTN